MLALRYVYLLALVVWLGGMLVIGGVAAPAIFDAMQSRAVATPRLVAGAAVGEMLRRFQLVSYASGALLVAALVGMALLGPRPGRFAVRVAIVGIMLAVSLYSGLVVTRNIQRLQQEIGAPASTLPEGDPRRAAFGRLHGLSTSLMLVNIAGGLILLYFEARAVE